MKELSRLVRGKFRSDSATGSIVPAIYQTATYVLDSIGEHRGFDYTRSSNPTRQQLEEHLAVIENGKFAVSFSSGMAACDSIFRLLRSGDHIVCSKDLYGGVSRLLNKSYSKFGVDVDYIDFNSKSTLENSVRENTKMVWIETPSNPLLEVIDLKMVSDFCKNMNLLSVCDSTFASPYLLKPLDFGFDLVVQSTSKYISGHNQLIGGAVITNREDFYSDLKFVQKSVGAIQSPFDSYLTILGIKTLGLRLEKHCSNAMEVANFLTESKKVKTVNYPGLKSHRQHLIAKEQMKNFGGMLSFELNADFVESKKFVNRLEFCLLAESLGGTETMITHPASMTHADVPLEVRQQQGLTDNLLRLSVGIEDPKDIIEDLKLGLSVI